MLTVETIVPWIVENTISKRILYSQLVWYYLILPYAAILDKKCSSFIKERIGLEKLIAPKKRLSILKMHSYIEDNQIGRVLGNYCNVMDLFVGKSQ